MLVSTINTFLACLVVLGQLTILVGVIYFFISRAKSKDAVWEFLNRYGLSLAFLVSLVATLGSLFYSEVAKYAVCELCWYQRILMYPQVLLLGLAVWKQDRGIAPYSLVLSSIGAVIAAYHYYIQVGGSAIASCGAVGYSVSCTEKFVMTFDYITIPMMSLTAFLMIILIMLQLKKGKI